MSSINNGTTMKQCSSLTSLTRQGADSGPDHNNSQNNHGSPTVTAKNDSERLYHSLNKRPKRRPAWLDSPNGLDGGGPVDAAMARASRDEFWAAIQPDYNYLMGRQLIDSCCQELLANSSQQPHLTTGGDKFSENQLQQPNLQQQPPDGSGPFSDVETELGGIKQWLTEAEVRIGPGITEWRDFRNWGKPGVPQALQRDAKMLDHKALHREIESRGRVLSHLLRLCETLDAPGDTASANNPEQSNEFPPHRRARAFKLAQRLYKRWQILYLKNLEWILHLETATSSADNLSDSSDSLSDESVTPARKKRMLTAPEVPDDAEMSPEIGCNENGEVPAASEAPAVMMLEPMDFVELEAQMYFNRSGRSKLANSAVFYFKHSTTEVSSNSSDNDEDDGWTYTPNDSNSKGARTRLNFDQQREEHHLHLRTPEVVDSTSGEGSEETSEPPSSPSPSPQHLSECSPSPSSEDLHTSVATCIGQSSPEKVVMRPKRSPQRVKRRPVSLPFSLMSPESLAVTPTSKTCSETNLATLSRKKRTMRRSKRRLQQASQSSESEDLMNRLAVLNQVSGVIRSSSFSGTRNLIPVLIPDGSHSDPSCKPAVHRRRSSFRTIIPPVIRVKDVTEESGEPSWDSYQERYNSEAYSEDIDAETARRLLEFGDDYSRYLREEFSDSSTNRRNFNENNSSRRRRDSKLPPLAPDSDSEVEELRYVLKLSQDSLSYTSQRLQEATDKFNELVSGMNKFGPDSILNVGELAEMAATCRESKKCVALVISRIEHDAAGIADLELIYELLERWEDLEAKTQELQRSSTLARQVASLRQALANVNLRQAELSLTHKMRNQHSRLECRLTLQLKLAAIKDQLAMLMAIKSQLSDTNMLIHRLSTEDNGTYRQQIKSMLKVQIAELYELWDQTNNGLSNELGRTDEHLVAWEELDRQLSSLRGSLLRDREVLLSGGKSKEVSDCGSLSDSGISDAGSDVLEAREKELTTLRALANQLPLQNRQDIVQELDAAEKELEQLRLYSSQRNLALSGLEPVSLTAQKSVCSPPDGSGGGGSGPRHWLKFVPLCLVTLLALVCSLLQPPNCCEYVNHGAGKYLEQLRFQNGPPPV